MTRTCRHTPPLVPAVLLALMAAAGPLAAQQPLCPERFHVTVDGHRLSLPYCSNRPIDRTDDSIDRIVFSIHGIGTNAVEYYDWMVRAAQRVAGQPERTLIIGPQLMTASDVRRMPIGDTDVYWQSSSDRYWGPLSASIDEHPRAARISMFEIMDRMLEQLTRPGLFPNLNTIVIAGHSGGGQFTNRYAAANVFDTDDIRQRIRIRYVVANPSTYVYLTSERAVPGSHDRFAVPTREQVTACPNYDRYGTGLEDIERVPYLQRVGPERMRRQYAEREVVYLMGEADNDPDASALARGCNAMMQGAHRLERGIIYYNMMKHQYGPAITERHSLATVPGVAHNAGRMWASDVGVRAIFEAEPRDPPPAVHVLATGGTISNATGGRRTGEELVAVLPNIDRIASVSVEQFSNVASSAISLAQWRGLSRRVNELFAARPDLGGIVVTHGTDTMEETAWFLDLTVADCRPIVVTGAMRNASAIAPDGPANLYNAIRLAAAPEARRIGAVVLMNDRVYGAREVAKVNTLRTDAFDAPDSGPIGVADGDRIAFHREPVGRSCGRPAFETSSDSLPRVDIVYTYQGADGALIRAAAAAGARGIVMATAGAGAMTPGQSAAIREVAEQGIVVVRSSRTGSGRVAVGGGNPAATSFGAGDLTPQKARILLMLALATTDDLARIRAFFDEY